MFSGCRLFMRFISVSSFTFLYRLDRWFSCLNGFTLVIFWALYCLLFGVSQSSVLKAVPWSIMVYFYKLLIGWRVVSFALIPHLPSFQTICMNMLKGSSMISLLFVGWSVFVDFVGTSEPWNQLFTVEYILL